MKFLTFAVATLLGIDTTNANCPNPVFTLCKIYNDGECKRERLSSKSTQIAIAEQYSEKFQQFTDFCV